MTVSVQVSPAIDAEHIAHQREWSIRTFGPGTRTEGVLNHIAKELDEIRAAPLDLSEWATGKLLGPERNQRMVDSGADLCLAFPLPGSRGTWDCVRRAEKAGIEVRVIKP